METKQTCPESIKKVNQNKPSKRSQKKKVAENQSQLSVGSSTRNSKLQKLRVSGVVSVPKQGSKGPSAALPAEKSKDKTENNQSASKGDSNKDEPKKQSRKKNKKFLAVTQKQNSALLAKKTEDTEQKAERTAREADDKGPLDQNVVTLSHCGSEVEKQRVLNEEIISKTGSEISKSKKRRIRKRRLLESLGINTINSVTSAKVKSTPKKRKKKKKSEYTEKSHTVIVESPYEDCTSVKSVNSNREVNGHVVSGSKETGDIVGKKGAVRKAEDTTSFTHSRKAPEQVIKVKETNLGKKVFADTLPDVKEGNITLNSSSAVRVCTSCEELESSRESRLSENKTPSEDISLHFLNKKEEPSPSERADLVNFLSHDNVEGLFRSALLNDVTLSSRCSEKEVKNFFNTYGTFSERGRTQFAAVEKLLHSSSKGSEGIASSQCFEPVLDKDISPNLTPHNSTAVVNKDPSLESCTSALTSIGSPKSDCLSLKHIKGNADADEPVSASCIGNFETDLSYNQVIKGLNCVDSIGSSLVFKGGLCRGPIYTSPNLENKVTSSSNSNQILNNASRTFVPGTCDSCDINQKDEICSCEVPTVQRLDSELVDGDIDLSVKEQFLPGDKTQPSEVCDVSEQSLTCPGQEDSSKEQALDCVKTADVDTVECQIDFVCKTDEVIECQTVEENVAQPHSLVNTECPKEQKSICTRINKTICTSQEKEDSERLPEKIQRNSEAEKYRWIGFVSECSEDIQESGFEASKTVESAVSLGKIEEGQKPDHFSQIIPAEVSYSDHNICNTGNESVFSKFHTDSNSKEQETSPVCSSVTEVSYCGSVESSPIPLPQSEVIMNPSQRKAMDNSNVHKPEKSREEILAAREAKKRARNKNKMVSASGVPSAESVAVTKTQTTSPSKSKEQSKSTTEGGKCESDYAAEGESVCKNTMQFSGMAEPPSPLRDMSHQKSELENSVLSKGTELKEKKDELPEVGHKLPAGSMKEDEASETTKILGEKVKEAGLGAQSLIVPPASKSKAELRAERRAKQEQQRALKAAQQKAKVPQAKSTVTIAAVNSKEKQPQKNAGDDVSKKVVKAVPVTSPKTSEHKVKLFNHLYLDKGPLTITDNLMRYGPDLHPAVVKLGMQYADRVVVGSNARCIALLDALKQVITDYETPPQKEFSRGLEAALQPSVAFLDCCRPLSVSMTNALRHLMWQLTQLPNNVSDLEAKKKLLEAIDTYIREQIEVAAQAICIMVQRKISNGDVILTYGCSSLLQHILLEAHRSGTKFRVVVVDGRPWREGREMLRRLVEHGLECSYILVSAASFIMREVTKVFLGAHALLANGYVMSRAGSSQVALLAHSYNVPVLVCCETHKFCERVQTDSFVYNELGNPDDLIVTDSCSKECPLSKWKSIGSLTPLNLTYDVTPPDLVTAVVTELAILPCTSVPVILRIKPTEAGC